MRATCVFKYNKFKYMALADVFRKIFGSKSDRDMKAIRPTLEKVLAAYVEIDALSDDALD